MLSPGCEPPCPIQAPTSPASLAAHTHSSQPALKFWPTKHRNLFRTEAAGHSLGQLSGATLGADAETAGSLTGVRETGVFGIRVGGVCSASPLSPRPGSVEKPLFARFPPCARVSWRTINRINPNSSRNSVNSSHPVSPIFLLPPSFRLPAPPRWHPPLRHC